jgi:hypothetical protein
MAEARMLPKIAVQGYSNEHLRPVKSKKSRERGRGLKDPWPSEEDMGSVWRLAEKPLTVERAAAAYLLLKMRTENVL